MNSAAAPRPAQGDVSTAQRVADAVLEVPGVVGLDSGPFGQLVTYLPGGRVGGVVVEETTGSVHVVVDIRHDLRAVAEEVLRVAEIESGLTMSVAVEDVATAETPRKSTVQQKSKVEHDG